MARERRIDRNNVFEMAVSSAVFYHQDSAVPFQNRGFNLAGLLVYQGTQLSLALDDFLSNLTYADRAERIGFGAANRAAAWSSATISAVVYLTRVA
jgi:hypothetical protein